MKLWAARLGNNILLGVFVANDQETALGLAIQVASSSGYKPQRITINPCLQCSIDIAPLTDEAMPISVISDLPN